MFLSFLILVSSCSEKSEVKIPVEEKTSDEVIKHDNVKRQDLAEHINNAMDNGRSMMPPRFPSGVNAANFMTKNHTALMKEQSTLLEILSSEEENLQKLDVELRKYIEQTKDPKIDFFLNQMAALRMIDILTNETEFSDELKEALAYYTQILLDYNYNRSIPIAKGLERLQGYWDDEKIAAAAELTIEQADAFNAMIIAQQEAFIEEIYTNKVLADSLKKMGFTIENARQTNTSLVARIEKEGIARLEALLK